MKSFLIAFTLFIVASAKYTPKSPKELVQIRDQCCMEHNVIGETYENIKKFKYADEPHVRCYMRCAAKKLGLWKECTGFDSDGIYDQFKFNGSKDVIKPKLEKCIKQNEHWPDECTSIYRQIMCMFNDGLLDTPKLPKLFDESKN